MVSTTLKVYVYHYSQCLDGRWSLAGEVYEEFGVTADLFVFGGPSLYLAACTVQDWSVPLSVSRVGCAHCQVH